MTVFIKGRYHRSFYLYLTILFSVARISWSFPAPTTGDVFLGIPPGPYWWEDYFWMKEQ